MCVFFLFFLVSTPPTPPIPPFFFFTTSPFQAKQNGCKQRVPAWIVECLRGLHSPWSSVTDSQPCVWQLLGSCCLSALWWSPLGLCNSPWGDKGGWVALEKRYRRDAQVWADTPQVERGGLQGEGKLFAVTKESFWTYCLNVFHWQFHELGELQSPAPVCLFLWHGNYFQ